MSLRRIMIVGGPGSGKSTLARALGDALDLPVIHIDHIHWQPGWVERPREGKTRLAREAEAGEAWVFEGGHSATWDTRLARADLLVWLDRPLGLRTWRVVRRAVAHRGRTRPDMQEGCPERLRMLPEFLRFIWRTRRTGPEAQARLAARAACPVAVVRSDREAAALVARLREGPGGRAPPDPRGWGVRGEGPPPPGSLL